MACTCVHVADTLCSKAGTRRCCRAGDQGRTSLCACSQGARKMPRAVRSAELAKPMRCDRSRRGSGRGSRRLGPSRRTYRHGASGSSRTDAAPAVGAPGSGPRRRTGGRRSRRLGPQRRSSGRGSRRLWPLRRTYGHGASGSSRTDAAKAVAASGSGPRRRIGGRRSRGLGPR